MRFEQPSNYGVDTEQTRTTWPGGYLIDTSLLVVAIDRD